MKFLFILFTLFTLGANAQTSGKTLGGNYPSGFSGFRNYAKNPGGEIDAQNVSVAGTGGTIGVFSNNPITNKKSFRVGGNLSTNITATFNFNSFDQGLADSTNTCAAAFNLQPNGVGTYTINVKLDSTTVATKSFTTTTGLPVQYQTFVFACGTFGQVPTIDVIANLTSGSGTDHFQADDFYMGQDPGFIGSMKISTQPAAYTPVFTGFGTVTNIECNQWQDGSFGYIDCKATAGTPTAVEARVSLPTGWTSSTFTQGIRSASGTLSAFNVNAARIVFPLIESNVSYITFGNQTSGTAGLTKLLGTTLVGTGDTISFTARIPISGASNINATTSQCLQDGSCVNSFSAQVASGGTVSNESLNWINGNCAIVSSQYECTLAITTSAVMNCTGTINETNNYAVNYIFGSSTTSKVVFRIVDSSTGTAVTNKAMSINCQRATTDWKPVMQAPWVSGSLTTNAPTPDLFIRSRLTCGNSGSAIVKSSGGVSIANGASAGLCTITVAGSDEAQCSCSVIGAATTSATHCLQTSVATGTIAIQRVRAGAAETGDITFNCGVPR